MRHLAEQIRGLNLQDVSLLVPVILAAVTIIDFVSTRRAAMIGRRRMSLR